MAENAPSSSTLVLDSAAGGGRAPNDETLTMLGQVLRAISDAVHAAADRCRDTLQALRFISILLSFVDALNRLTASVSVKSYPRERSVAFDRWLVAAPSRWAAP